MELIIFLLVLAAVFVVIKSIVSLSNKAEKKPLLKKEEVIVQKVATDWAKAKTSSEILIKKNFELIKSFLENIQKNSSQQDILINVENCFQEIQKIENRNSNTQQQTPDLVLLKQYLLENFNGRNNYFISRDQNIINERIEQEREMKKKEIENRLRNADEVNKLSGVDFEKHVAQFLKGKGYEIETTPTTGDQGADLIATKNGKRISIQTKRYEGTVGNKAVQEAMAGKVYYKCDESWVITNSSFTPSAKELAKRGSVKLLDGTDLEKQINF